MNIGISYKNINENGTTKLTSGVNLIKDELTLLLNMPKYSMFFGNNMGLDLEKYLYLRNRKAVYHLIKDDITNVLDNYGKVRLRELRILFNDYELKIILEVAVRATNELILLPLTLRM